MEEIKRLSAFGDRKMSKLNRTNPWGFESNGDKVLAFLAVGCLAAAGCILLGAGLYYLFRGEYGGIVSLLAGVILFIPSIIMLPSDLSHEIIRWWGGKIK